MSTAAPLTVAKWQQRPTCPSTHEPINKMCFHTMKYPAAKTKQNKTKNEILIHPITWMNLEHTMRSEGRQPQRTTPRRLSFIGSVQNKQNKTESRWMGVRGRGVVGVNGTGLLMGMGFCYGDTNTPKLAIGDVWAIL